MFARPYAENGAGPDPRVALRWTTPGKRKLERPKYTWCRTATQTLENMNLANMLPRTECSGMSIVWAKMNYTLVNVKYI